LIPKEQRVLIGQEIVDGLISSKDAAKKYDISLASAQQYATDYKRANGIPLNPCAPKHTGQDSVRVKSSSDIFNLEDYQSMTKEQLIEELIKSKINEARAKKGYEVKGDGQNKEFISINNKSSK